ncbi:MAG: GspE/PulE family protein [Firmicutes bacterium]|nr:GspE/PulE family protein [Bacillota bacterium]
MEQALAVQRRMPGRRLGEVLVELGFVAENDLAQVLARQAGTEYQYGSFPVDPAAARRIAREQAEAWRALPIADEGGVLVVAVVDPFDVWALDNVRLATGREVRPVVVTARDFGRAIDRAYGAVGASPAAAARVEDTGVVRLLDDLLARAVAERASDVHVEPQGEEGVRIRLRVDGVLVEATRLPASLHAPLLTRIKILGGMDIAEHRLPQDGRAERAVQGRTVDIRVSVLPTIHGEKAALRLLDKSERLLGLDEIGLEGEGLARYRRMIGRPHGLVLVSGPTGSGKTTTVMAAVAALNRVERNVVTIEDPVEYQLPGLNQVQVNARAGLGFAEGLRAILRQDPDVVVVGEIRDPETAEIAVRAALTGHLVLSSIHTNSAASTPGRLLDMGVPPYLVASALIGVVAQRLARRLCPRCRRPLPPDAPARSLAAPVGEHDALYEAVGCAYCSRTGYRGRLGLFEVLAVTPAVQQAIMARARAEELERLAVEEGMQTLAENGLARARQGLTSLDEVRRVAYAEG